MVHGLADLVSLTDLGQLAGATLALLILAAFVAGWVDAVVGGGGLIQLPALLIGLPDGTPPAAILGTNKISLGLGHGHQLDHLRGQDQARLAHHHPAGRRLGRRLGARRAARPVPAQGVLHPDRAGPP